MLCLYSQDVSRVFHCVVFDKSGVNKQQGERGAAIEFESWGQLAGVEIEITSWKARAYGIFTRFGAVSEIERVSAANEWDFWYFTSECENPVQSAFHAVVCLFRTYWDSAKPQIYIRYFYLTCIRPGPVLECCVRLYHHALPDYLSNDIECAKKHAQSVISPGLSHLDKFSLFKRNSLKDSFERRHQVYCHGRRFCF